MIIDHLGFAVANTENSKLFYTKVLQPLGIECIAEDHGWIGFGVKGGHKAELWFGEDDGKDSGENNGKDIRVDNAAHAPMHIAFKAENREQVNAFYNAAIAAGASCNGKPGIRKIYHPDYYGAFVIDPDGHNIEAVCHSAE